MQLIVCTYLMSEAGRTAAPTDSAMHAAHGSHEPNMHCLEFFPVRETVAYYFVSFFTLGKRSYSLGPCMFKMEF